MIKRPQTRFCRNKIALGVAGALMGTVFQAQAVNFELGDFEISFDSTFSYGQSWRVEDRDMELVGKPNVPNQFDYSGYHIATNPIYSSSQVWAGQGGYSTNGDASNLNFNPNETFSKVFKGLHELDVHYDGMGVFVRGMYFYDFELMDNDRDSTSNLTGNQVDPCRDDDARDFACRDIRLLDAFFYADFDIGDTPVSIRVGDQVISWGESTLIAHGISEINPVDASRLKAPGAELKEAFIPYGAVWASVGVTDNFNVEAFYQYRWEETVVPVPGTYFATNDFVGEGGHYNNAQLQFSSNPDITLDKTITDLNSFATQYRAAVAAGDTATQAALQQAYVNFGVKTALRPEDGVFEPDDGGQYGLRLSYLSPELNDTEFSLYYMNYHSRRPFISGVTSNFTSEAIARDIAYLAANQIDYDNVADLEIFTKANLYYPEDIKLYGFSFNTSIGETAFAGELSYRQDEPLQIDDVELLYAAMPEQLALAGIRPDLAGISQMDVPEPGGSADGFILSDTTQLQFTLTHLFGPTLGAAQFTLLAEAGGIQINDMPDPCELRLNGSGTARSGECGTFVTDTSNRRGLHIGVSDGPETNPFPSKTSWGYKMIAKLDYNNVFWGVNVSPKLAFSHDVNGITPDPIGLFIEDRKSLGATITFEYQSTISAEIAYNAFWGGVGTTNQFSDRDFVSFNIKYSI